MPLRPAIAGFFEEQTSPNIVGIWQGTLKAGTVELRLVVKIEAQPDGKLTGSMDSPDQGAKGIPISEVSVQDGRVRLVVQAVMGLFEGTLSEDGKKITGEWKQSGITLPLTLERSEKAPEVRRPQEPRKPYPYREEEVQFENKKAGVRIAGTLTLPPGKPPFPAVILITGSGPQDRDETVAGHRPFLIIADYLTRRGIACLRTDDRGVGGSTGNLSESTSADLAEDVLAAIEFLKTREEIDHRSIGLIGHSEGGIIAPMVAARSSDVAFLVLLAAPGLRGEQIVLLQSELIAKSMGEFPEGIKRSLQLTRRLFQIVKRQKDDEAAQREIQQAVAAFAESLNEEERKELEQSATPKQLQQLTTPWFRFFLTYDPRFTLHKVRCPVLALYGEKDLQVPPKENAPAVYESLKAGGNKQVTVKVFTGLNHLFQHCQTGSPVEYARIEETFAPEVLKTIGDWILQQARR